MSKKVYHQTRLGSAQSAIIAMIQPQSTVLEVGCATGYMTRVLHEELHCPVTAVEINPAQASAAEQYTDHLIIGDIAQSHTWDELHKQFKYILFADVLEHLADPWAVLQRARASLYPDGCILASIPNIAYYKIRKQLLFGQFDYTSSGILDDSHLRFFTEKTVRALFNDSGYVIDRFQRIFRGRTDRRLWWANPNAFTYQFVIKANPHEG